ncbi:hypothetical protein ACTFIR_004442 [Dictyostelium discoideum]
MESKEIVVQSNEQTENSSGSGSSEESKIGGMKTNWSSDENSRLEMELAEARDTIEKMNADCISVKMIHDHRSNALEKSSEDHDKWVPLHYLDEFQQLIKNFEKESEKLLSEGTVHKK